MSHLRSVLAALFASVAVHEQPARAQELLLDIPGPSPGGQASGVAIGDWNADGVPDIALAIMKDDTVATDAGAVHVVSGTDASVLATFYGVNAGDFFGTVVAAMPDLDGDTISDFTVGVPHASFTGLATGSVYLYAGRSGTLILRID